MAIYYMHGGTFKDIFLKENPNKILKSTFILISTCIRTNGKFKDNVINLCNVLYPDKDILRDVNDVLNMKFKKKDIIADSTFRDLYRKQLNDNKLLLARIVKEAVNSNNTVVLLCSEKEYDMCYMQILVEYIEEVFDFPVYNYKKVKKGKEKSRPFGKNHVLYRCEKVIEKAIEQKRKELMKSKSGRKKILNSMTKEEMIKMMKKKQLYVSGMEKDEMYETLDVYFVNGHDD